MWTTESRKFVKSPVGLHWDEHKTSTRRKFAPLKHNWKQNRALSPQLILAILRCGFVVNVATAQPDSVAHYRTPGVHKNNLSLCHVKVN